MTRSTSLIKLSGRLSARRTVVVPAAADPTQFALLESSTVVEQFVSALAVSHDAFGDLAASEFSAPAISSASPLDLQRVCLLDAGSLK